MHSTVTAIGVVLMSLPLAAVALGEDQDSVTELFEELRREYDAASGKIRQATTDEQRIEVFELMGKCSRKFSDLADGNADHPVALHALRQAFQAIVSTDSHGQRTAEMNREVFPTVQKDDSARRAVEILLRDHAKNAQLGLHCERMRYGIRTEFETCLRSILENSPHREVQAVACLSLARFLNSRVYLRDRVEGQPEMTRRYEAVFGKAFVRELRKANRAERSKEIESLFEKALAYADVKTSYGGTVRAQAESELHELRHLSVGKIAPEIEGRDQDGEQLRLSQFRGKVVLLYFWLEF